MLKFAKLCGLARSLLFPPQKDYKFGSDFDSIKAGIPLTACIVWGEMGPSFQTQTRVEVKDGQSFILGTSIPWPNRPRIDSVLRKQLFTIRHKEFFAAFPELLGIDTGPDASPGYGHCAEHGAWLMYVPLQYFWVYLTQYAMRLYSLFSLATRNGEYEGLAVDIPTAQNLSSLEHVDMKIFKRACPRCLLAIENMHMSYKDRADPEDTTEGKSSPPDSDLKPLFC